MHRVFTCVLCFALACATAQAASTLVVPDQYSSIQKAIDAAKRGDTVRVKAGVYVIKKGINLKSGIVLAGDGRDVVTVSSKEAENPVLDLYDVGGVKISGLTLEHAGSREQKIKLKSSDRDIRSVISVVSSSVEINDCIIRGGYVDGISIWQEAEAVVKGCRIEKNLRNGVYVYGYGSSATISDNEIVENASAGLRFVDSEGSGERNVCSRNSHGIGISGDESEVTLSQNKCDDNKNTGIFVQEEADPIIEGNTCSGNRFAGIMIGDEGTDPTIRGNTFSGNKKTGMNIRKRAGGIVEGNTCSNNAESGIVVTGVDNQIVLTNNLCEKNKQDGISFTCGSTGTLEENICRGNGGRGIFVAYEGTKATLSSNECSENNANGILIERGADVHASNNICSKNTRTGIAIGGFGTNPTIENNKSIDNKRYGIWIGHDAEGIVRGNECSGNSLTGIFVVSKHAEPILENNDTHDNAEGDIKIDRESSYDETWVYEAEVEWLFRSESFDRLERMATVLRRDKLRYESGSWQLNWFHKNLRIDKYKSTNNSPERNVKISNNWIKAYPDSVSARIALAKAYKNMAWDARGGGYVNTVSKEGWRKFGEYLDKAEGVLSEAEKLEQKDPELYALMVIVGMGNGWSDGRIRDAFQKGLAIEPNYYPLFYYYCDTLLPRWGGKYGDVERLADEAVEMTKEFDGEAMYALIADDVRSYVGNADYVRVHNFSWPRVKKGFDDFLEARPESIYRRNNYCLMACLHKDQDKANELFEEIGEDWESYFWKNEESLNEWKQWATGVGEYPELKRRSSSGPRSIAEMILGEGQGNTSAFRFILLAVLVSIPVGFSILVLAAVMFFKALDKRKKRA